MATDDPGLSGEISERLCSWLWQLPRCQDSASPLVCKMRVSGILEQNEKGLSVLDATNQMALCSTDYWSQALDGLKRVMLNRSYHQGDGHVSSS